MSEKFTSIVVVLAIFLSSCSKPAEISAIVGTWKPTEAFYDRFEREANSNNDPFGPVHLSGPVRFFFHIDQVEKEFLITRRVEGDPKGLQDYRIVEGDGAFVAVPILLGALPEMPLEILDEDKIVFTHHIDGKIPMTRASEAHNKPE